MQTIGERLEEARKKKGISIREAAESTKIRGDYLQKFESNHFDIGLTEIYTRGFLRTYSNYLKLPADRILNDYTALGRGEARPRQPSREVYGRMDITVATAEPGDRPAPAPEAPPEPSHANRGPTRPRTGSSLPTGLDPAVVFKYMKIGGIVVIVLLVLLILKSLFTGASSSPTAAPRTPVLRGSTLGLVALRPVKVHVTRPSPDNPEDDGEVLYSGTMAAGERRMVPWPGDIFVKAEPRDNLDLEINGRRQNLGQSLAREGPNVVRGRLPAPTP